MLDLTVYTPLTLVLSLVLGLAIIILLLTWLLPTYSQEDISIRQEISHQDDD